LPVTTVQIEKKAISAGSDYGCWGPTGGRYDDGFRGGWCSAKATLKVVIRYGIGHDNTLYGFGCDAHADQIAERLSRAA
jgi:hypothetical protein